MLLGLVLANLCIFFGVLAGWGLGHIALRDLVLVGVFVVSVFAPVGLVRLGAIRAACWTLVMFLQFGAVSQFLRGSVEPIGILVLALSAALAALVLGMRPAIGVALLSMLLVLGFSHAFHVGWLTPWLEQPHLLIYWTVIVTELVALAQMVFLATRGLREDLHSSTQSRDHGFDLLLSLSRASQAVQAARTPADVYRIVGDEAASLGFRATAFVLTDDRSQLSMPHIAVAPAVKQKIQALTGLRPEGHTFALDPGGHFEKAALGGEVEFFEHTSDVLSEVLPSNLRRLTGAIVALVGDRSAFLVPLQPFGEPFGTLMVTGVGIGESDRPAVLVFADQIGVALSRLRSREALVRATGLAEDANRAKSRFLASISHELRTPLNAVLGFSKLLGEGAFGEINTGQGEVLGDIQGSSEHLRDLIDDILDIAKIEEGRMELHVSIVEVDSILAASLNVIRPEADAEGINLEYLAGTEIRELRIPADERKLKQILYNLLSNAAKFTPGGGTITLGAKVEGDVLEVTVTDTGAGVPTLEHDRVFDTYYQIDRSPQDRTPGTGLGLPLTRQMVEAHGGRIALERAPGGGGCEFTFTLPLVER